VQAGRIDPKALITHRVPLEDISDAYHIFASKLDGCIKPILLPNGPVSNLGGWSWLRPT
jgi:threonine dehydrogenase-like Zn-dependent dehydrogenase